MWPQDSAALASLLFYFLLLCCNLHFHHCSAPFHMRQASQLIFYTFLPQHFNFSVVLHIDVTVLLTFNAHCLSTTFLPLEACHYSTFLQPCLLCSLPQDARLSSIRIDPTCPTTANIFSGKERSKAAALSLGGKVGSDLKSNQSDRKSLNSFEKRKVSGLELEMPRLFGLWNWKSSQKSKWKWHII